MFLLKEIIVLAGILILASFGLVELSHPFWNSAQDNKKTNSAAHSFENNKSNKYSSEFYQYLDQVLNSPIDKKNIKNQISEIESEFEKEYLSALLQKREGNFDDAFSRLFSQLDKSPDYLPYYEEIASLGKISENIKTLDEWISSGTDATNRFTKYLTALIDFQKGNVSESIKQFQVLVDEEFVSKEIYYQLAQAFRIAGDYENSLKNLQEAEKHCLANDPYLAKVINLKGTLFFLSGDYENSKAEYQSAIKISNQTGNKVEEIKARANLAIIKDVYGEIYDAREDFLNAIKMAEQIENHELLAFLYSELGVSFTYTSNLVEARKYYEKSFSAYGLLNNDERLAYLSSNIGSLYLQISNYKSALSYYQKGLKYSGENKLGQILNLTGLADVYSNESNYAKALDYYKRAKDIADSVKDISSSLKIDQGIGALYFNINRPANALEVLKNAESILNESEAPFEAIKLYSKIGTVLTSVDSFKQAESYFMKGINLSDKVGDIYNSIVLKTELAHNYYYQGELKKAEQLLNSVRPETEGYELTQLLGLQGVYLGKIYYAQGRFEKFSDELKNSFQLSSSVHDYNTQIDAGYLLAKYYDEINQNEEAKKWYLIVTDIVENISIPLNLNQEIQIAHFSGLDDIYNSLTEFYLDQGDVESAFMTIEKSRSRNTRMNLDKLKLQSMLDDETDYKKFIDLQWMISTGLHTKSNKDSLQRDFAEIKKELVQKNKEAFNFLNNGNSMTISDMQQRLKAEEYIISFYLSDDLVSIFILNSDELIIEEVEISRDSLLEMISAISPIYKSGLESEEVYVNEDLFSFNAYASYKLYTTVFKEFLNNVPVSSRIIVNFPTELIKLPIELLVTSWNKDESPYYYNDKKFLINDYHISYTPSASIYIKQLSESQANTTQNLLVGDPFISNSAFALSVRSGLVDTSPSQSRNIKLYPLEFSGDEIISIESTLNNNVVFLSENATEANFKQNAARSNIIHISTHSFLLKDQPLILFSAEEDELEDGFLELGEIVQLDLNSEMVVLSSCRSGLGRTDEAEGIIGMQKAFFEAGSKSVLVTLWDVNDKYTSYFMKDFYKHLAGGKSKSEALQQTKIEFINKHSANPYYWSAFVLSGDPSTIKLQEATTQTFIYIIGIVLLMGLLYFVINRLRQAQIQQKG